MPQPDATASHPPLKPAKKTHRWRRGANSSLETKFPISREKYREFHRFGHRWRVTSGQKREIKSVPYGANSLRVRTGNFLTPYREIKSTDQGTFHRDQGNPALLLRYLAFRLVTEDRCAYRRPGALPVTPRLAGTPRPSRSPLAGHGNCLGRRRVSGGSETFI